MLESMVNNATPVKELVQKWEKALDGIEEAHIRETTAMLLENQAKSIVLEQTRIDEAAVTTGATTVGKLGTFQKFAFPLVRRVFPELFAQNIVGVQPMTGPTSQIFYLGHDRAYNTTVQSVYSKYAITYRGLVNTSIGSRTAGTGLEHVGVSAGTGDMGTDNANGLDLDVTGSVDLSSVLAEHAGSVSSTYGGQIASWPDASTILGWSVSAGERLAGTSIPEVTFHIQQQPVVARTRKMRALWTLEASQDLKAYHNIDLERELTDLLSKELSLEIDREILEDLRMLAYRPATATDEFGGWYESSLDNGNSNKFQSTGGKGPNEANTFAPSAFLYDLHANVPVSDPIGTNVILVDLTASSPGGLGSTSFAPQHLGHRYANLLAVVNFASQDIYRTTQRGMGTILVTSPIVATMLESAAKLEGGLPESAKPTNIGGSTISYKGKFFGKYDLYVDPMWPQDEILVAYKGQGPMDAGYVYCPYIPLQQLPTITDPESFQPRKGILTRYGKAAVAPASRFYRVVRLVGPTEDHMLDPFRRVTVRDGTALTGY